MKPAEKSKTKIEKGANGVKAKKKQSKTKRQKLSEKTVKDTAQHGMKI